MDLTTRLKRVLTSAAGASLAIFGLASTAGATNINTHGASCQNYATYSPTDLSRFSDGIRNVSANTGYVLCPIARSPLSAASGGFYIDGSNRNGGVTSCSIFTYEYNGTLKAIKSFTSSAARYDQFLSFTNVELPYGAYVSMLCSLPASSNGVLWGITAIQ